MLMTSRGAAWVDGVEVARWWPKIKMPGITQLVPVYGCSVCRSGLDEHPGCRGGRRIRSGANNGAAHIVRSGRRARSSRRNTQADAARVHPAGLAEWNRGSIRTPQLAALGVGACADPAAWIAAHIADIACIGAAHGAARKRGRTAVLTRACHTDCTADTACGVATDLVGRARVGTASVRPFTTESGTSRAVGGGDTMSGIADGDRAKLAAGL